MRKFILQYKGRFGWEDMKYFYDFKLCKNYFNCLREKGLNVRIIEVLVR